ncbi:hypothetical protein [Rhodopirellula sallentina]|uniref:hypothetical protein n=1 Tax=Rhodopirellula sallentina TaxID=1263869 RepID=UPI0011819324|nr:hypothetical protein [Rhodopirellula sallentina]
MTRPSRFGERGLGHGDSSRGSGSLFWDQRYSDPIANPLPSLPTPIVSRFVQRNGSGQGSDRRPEQERS